MAITEVTCMVCGKVFERAVVPAHLTSKHNMTMKEYREKFPDAPIETDAYKAKLAEMRNRLYGKKEAVKENETEEEYDIGLSDLESSPKVKRESLPVIKDIDFSKIEKLKLDSIEDSIKASNFFEDPKGLIPSDKLRILNYLACNFDGVENNFFIEKTSLSGHTEYRLVTDIAIPLRKIDIEFPKAFWHNYDIPKEVRDDKLRSNGWKIYEVNEVAPSIATIDKIIEEIKRKV